MANQQLHNIRNMGSGLRSYGISYDEYPLLKAISMLIRDSSASLRPPSPAMFFAGEDAARNTRTKEAK